MSIINEKGKIFGILNIIDFVIFLFVVAVICTILVYIYAPPTVHEHKEAIFQLYFPNIVYSAADAALIPGNSLMAYQPGDEATITNVIFIINETRYSSPPYSINLLSSSMHDITIDAVVTVNASLEVGTSGQLLFNGFEIASGNYMDVDIVNSHLQAIVYRTNYTYSSENKQILFLLDPTSSVPSGDESLVDGNGKSIGKIIEVQSKKTREDKPIFVLMNISVDEYNGKYFLNEIPLLPFRTLVLLTNEAIITGTIVNVE